jgi:imidazolonepropionase-like amidohydrolase
MRAFLFTVLACTPLFVAAADPAPSPAPSLIIRSARVFDGHNAKLLEGVDIVIAGNKIVGLGPAAGKDAPAARIIDVQGRTVIPGLIDAHVHPAMTVSPSALSEYDPSYVVARSTVEARGILMRGFTTVRDMGGPSFGLKRAIDEGLLDGPRIFPSGAIVSQTSGHGDHRERADSPPRRWSGRTDTAERLGFSLTADGADEVLAAVREQLRLGATQIKLTAGGGISSSWDPIDSVQFLLPELRAAVDAAADWGTYVAVHAYTPVAIRRSVEAGVRSIEHAHLIDEPTMKLIADKGVFLSPQSFLFSRAGSPGDPLAPSGPPSPTQQAQREKALLVSTGLDRMMQLARKYNVKVAFGTDVFGSPRAFGLESREFGSRLRWFTPLEILRQATSINGELLALSGPRNGYGKLGVIEPGAVADLLVLAADPLQDIKVLEDPEKNLLLIVKDGRVVRNQL